MALENMDEWKSEVFKKIIADKEFLHDEKKITEFIEFCAQEIFMSAEITRNIIKNNDYINWLEEFIANNKSFSDSHLLGYPDDTTMFEEKNISKLTNFYDVIEMYAEKNYIYPSKDDIGKHYNIKYNNIGYEIGTANVLGGSVHWVRKHELSTDKQDDFIDFKDIQENKITKEARNTKKYLTNLETFLNLLVEDVPVEAIEKTTNAWVKALKDNGKYK